MTGHLDLRRMFGSLLGLCAIAASMYWLYWSFVIVVFTLNAGVLDNFLPFGPLSIIAILASGLASLILASILLFKSKPRLPRRIKTLLWLGAIAACLSYFLPAAEIYPWSDLLSLFPISGVILVGSLISFQILEGAY